MKTVVLIVHLDVPDDINIHSFDVYGLFGKSLIEWKSYAPLEDNAPIRINITSDGFEEI